MTPTTDTPKDTDTLTLLPAETGDDDGTPQLPAVHLDSPHAFALVRRVLQDGASELKKLSEKVSGEGYQREARIIAGDAAYLNERIIPAFSAQAEIPLATSDELQASIANALRGLVRVHAKPATDDIDHEAVLLERVAKKMALVVHEAAALAFNAGVQFRQFSPEAVGVQAIAATIGRSPA